MRAGRPYHPVPAMRLVTYDRDGSRRLGAWVGGLVVDLPEAVGHPSFPRTMEALVARHGGTTIEAAADVLSRPTLVRRHSVRAARLLAPFVPRFATHAVLGPDDDVSWPPAQRYLDHAPKLACVIGSSLRLATARRAARAIFGYVLMTEWRATRGSRAAVAISFGPWIVTPDELAGAAGEHIVSSVDGEVVASLPLRGAPGAFSVLAATRSQTQRGLRAGTVLASSLGRRSRGVGLPLERASSVEVDGGSLGAISATLGAPAQSMSPSPFAQLVP